VLETQHILKATGMHKGNVWRVIDGALAASPSESGNALAQAIRQRGWTKGTRKAVALPGKGFVLTRQPQQIHDAGPVQEAS
jgi:hypothetical protein